MGNRFAIQGLGDEATHGRRDDKARRTGSGWRPSDPELADERILTKEVIRSSDVLQWRPSRGARSEEFRSDEIRR